jgi:hypothetical protein
MSFELKLQLTGTTKTVLLWNVIEKSPEEFVELFYSVAFHNGLPSRL